MVSTKKSALSNICTNWQRYFGLSFSTNPLKSRKEDTKEIKRKDNLRNVIISFWENHNREVAAKVEFSCSEITRIEQKVFWKVRSRGKNIFTSLSTIFFVYLFMLTQNLSKCSLWFSDERFSTYAVAKHTQTDFQSRRSELSHNSVR